MGAIKLTSQTKPAFDNPEIFAGAVAHVVKHDAQNPQILGQCWLVANGSLVTCGHVVEQFLNEPQSLSVKFPGSGNSYEVKAIRLHPSFVRQADQLVKYDAALLEVDLIHPEKTAPPLPIIYERNLKPNQSIWTVRFPIHIGNLSAATQPLAQTGTLLGFLRKFDAFHLLHDLALSPGDSGAALLEGGTVIGLHCGDTASVPGLNLPTTSIRMALWVDALRELGVPETANIKDARVEHSLVGLRVAIALSTFAFSLILCVAALAYFERRERPFKLNVLHEAPLEVEVDKSDNASSALPEVGLTLRAHDSNRLFVFGFDGEKGDRGSLIYPAGGPEETGGNLSEKHFSQEQLMDLRGKCPNLYILSAGPAATIEDHLSDKQRTSIDRESLARIVAEIEKAQPEAIIAESFDLRTIHELADPTAKVPAKSSRSSNLEAGAPVKTSEAAAVPKNDANTAE